jgi:hypothetical protein
MTSRKKPQNKTSRVPFYVGGGILALLLIAFITTGLREDGSDNGNGTPGAQEFAEVNVSGSTLPPYPRDQSPDTAPGLPMPEVTGESFDGTPVSITNDGQPKAILFLAHW